MRGFALIACLISAGALYAQQLTEKVEVNLVNVDVTVTSNGAPARGLTRDDFEVLEDGVLQTITNFYAIEGARESWTRRRRTIRGQPAAPAPAEERFRRKVLVIVDNRHTSRHNRDVALQRLEKFINERFAADLRLVDRHDHDRAYLVLPLTSDKARIHEALSTVRDAMTERTMRQIAETDAAIAQRSQQIDTVDRTVPAQLSPLSGNPGSTNVDALNRMLDTGKRFEQAADVTITYSAIRDATRSFASTQGRKIILLLTGAFSDEEIRSTPLKKRTRRVTPRG